MASKNVLLDVTALVLQCLIGYVSSDRYKVNRSITYKELANTVNHRQVICRTLGRQLGNILELCKRLKAPILPVIVASKATGEPGEGFTRL